MASFDEASRAAAAGGGAMSRLKGHHRRAFESLAMALDLDESLKSAATGRDQVAGSPEQLERLVGLYRHGVSELRAGLAVRPDQPGGSDAEKFRSLQAKMRDNLTRAAERLAVVEAAAAKVQGRRPTPSPGAAAAAPVKKLAWVARKPAAAAPAPSAAGGRHPRPQSAAPELKGVDPALANSILNEVLDRSPGVAFADVVGSEAAKEALREATVLPALRPDLFCGGLRQPARAVLLFGPPGNGKTLLAKAVATEAGGVFFNISAGSLVSKWVGEAEKLVRALFALARRLAPSVIFIDEVDSILGQRSDRETEVSRRLKTQFLVELDGVRAATDDAGAASPPRVFLLAATNRPQEIDSAVVRRFSRRLYVGMPDIDARADLLRSLLRRHDSVRVTDAELAEIAGLTDGYSASDLANLARDAAMEPLRQMRPDRLATVAKGAVRPLVAEDLRNCLRRVRPSVPPESLRELIDWAEKYGDAASS